MYSSLKNLPSQEQQRILEEIQGEIKDGTHNPIPMLLRDLKNRERTLFRNSISLGVTASFLSVVVAGTTFNLTPGLIGVLGGGIMCAIGLPARNRLKEVCTAIEKEDTEVLAEYLTDQELDDLENFRQKFQPKTEEAEEGYRTITVLCNKVFQEEEPAILASGGPERKSLKPADSPEVDMSKPTYGPEYTEPNPWGKESEVSAGSGNKLKKLVLSEDDFTDKVQQSVNSAAEKALASRLDEFEAAIMAAFEATKPGGDPNHIDPNHIVSFKTFDPTTEQEDEREFDMFKALVEVEKLSPTGGPIMQRMWGVSSGGSKKAQAARDRRDEFASRLSLLESSSIRLYGE